MSKVEQWGPYVVMASIAIIVVILMVSLGQHGKVRTRHIKLYSGGQVVGEWDSKGDVAYDCCSAWFIDAATGKRTLVAGTFTSSLEDK